LIGDDKAVHCPCLKTLRGKQALVSALREAGLLGRVEAARFYVDLIQTYRANSRFLGSHPGVLLPSRRLLHRTYGTAKMSAYYNGGLNTARYIARVVADLGFHGPGTICDWGCGAGRVIRHLPDCLGDGSVRLVGTDCDADAIGWCANSFPDIGFLANDVRPPLPFPANEFDFLYGISVLTHLSAELHRQWLDELLRVVRPGGHVLLTVHGEFFRDRLLASERRDFDAGRLVVRGGVRDGTRLFTAFQSERYMRNELLRGQDIVLFEPTADPNCLTQDVWVFRVPE